MSVGKNFNSILTQFAAELVGIFNRILLKFACKMDEAYGRIALLESRLINLTNEIQFAIDYKSQNVDVFFLLTMAMIIFCKPSKLSLITVLLI